MSIISMPVDIQEKSALYSSRTTSNMLSTETLNARNPSEVPATGDISGTPPAVNSRILGIPPELQAIILSHLTVADLRRLCLTSQHLRNAALPILYENLQLGLPHHRAFVRILEQLVNSRGLKYTKSICVMDSPYMGYYGLEEDDLRSDEGDSDSDGSDFDFDTQRPKSNIKAPDLSAMLNCLIRLVVGKIPQNKLRSFKWQHSFVLSPDTIAECSRKHPATFSELAVEYQSVSWNCQSSKRCLWNIQSLELGCITTIKPIKWIHSGAAIVPHVSSPSWIGQTIYDNAPYLRRLKLGTENCLVKYYLEHDGGLDPLTQTRTLRGLYDMMGNHDEVSQPPSVPKPVIAPLHLNSLHLIGVDVHLTLSEGLPRVFRFSSLETFYLESCIGSEELLESLAVSFGSTSNDQVPKIKDFRFRHEDSTTSLRVAVGKFLSSFSGLRSLSILLDRTEAMPHPRCFTEKHGKTLKTLVWDGRSEPRSHFCLSTAVVASDPFVHSELVFISENCPHLVELGVSIDWRHHYHGIATSTRQLKSLRTFNIRNPPETSLPTIGSSASILPVGKFPRIAATEMMESMMESEFFMTARRLKPCSVKLIAIGSITFRHIRPVPRVDVDGIEDEDEDEELREFLTPRFFLIKYHRDAFGERKPLLTEVGMGTSYGVEAFEPNLEIFKPYWLS